MLFFSLTFVHDKSMSNISRQRILNVMGTFRPAFRTIAQTLTDIDLVLVEEAFERLLLVSEYAIRKRRTALSTWSTLSSSLIN